MTKQSPTCLHGALIYLSELTGMSVKKEIVLDGIEQTRQPNNKNGRLLYPAYNIFVIIQGKKYWWPTKRQVKGGETIWVFRNDPTDYEAMFTEFPLSVVFDKVGVVISRAIDEFGIPSEKIGPYKDSLGGGWYQNCTMYKVGDCYYVPDMECTCN